MTRTAPSPEPSSFVPRSHAAPGLRPLRPPPRPRRISVRTAPPPRARRASLVRRPTARPASVQVGLLDFVRTNLLRQRVAVLPVPDISSERLRWFEHFDEDKKGSLMQEELVRALIKTYKLAADNAQVIHL